MNSRTKQPIPLNTTKPDTKHDADYVFYELTRSICPECRQVIDAHILLRDDKVFMRKRCPDHGLFEALVYGDAMAYTHSTKFNKPGTIPAGFATAKRLASATGQVVRVEKLGYALIIGHKPA
jgi:hypothetical protein